MTIDAQRATRTSASTHGESNVLVVSGGSGGIAVAARLRRALGPGLVTVIEPSDRHWYQPLWTLVGGGAASLASSGRPQASVVPKGVEWIRDAVVELFPDECAVGTAGGRTIAYDWLVLAPGLETDDLAIPGYAESVGRGAVHTIWGADSAEATWEAIRSFRGGTALFTYPSTPIKCPGAAQKIMYLADDTFRRNGVRGRSEVMFASAAPGIFAVERYAQTLRAVVERREIQTRFQTELVEIRPDSREAVLEDHATGRLIVQPYDLLHVAPPQRAPAVVSRSALADPRGWVDVDPATLRHRRYDNVFSLGDASSLPTSKTGAAVRAQAPVLVGNLLAARASRPPSATYDGYTACPLVTGYGKLVLAEFDYQLQPRETFPVDQSKERRSMYLLKKHLLPRLYWHGILRGRA